MPELMVILLTVSSAFAIFYLSLRLF